MPVKIQPTSIIKTRLGIEPNGRVQRYFTNSCYRHMDKYVPMDKGDLRTNVQILPDSIIYQSPYARYQYYGVRKDGTHKVQSYTTPGSGPYWDKRMVSAEMQNIINEVQNYIGGK